MMLPESLATATVSAGLLLGMAMALIAVIVTTRRSSAVFVMIAAAIVAAMLITVVVVPTDVPLPIALPLALLGASVAVVGGNPLTREVLRLATKGTVRDGEHGGILLRSAREDDAAAVLHRLAGLARQQDAGPQVDRDESIELLFVGELRAGASQDVHAGVVDPDIDVPEGSGGLFKKRRGSFRGSQVSLEKFTAAAPGVDLIPERLALGHRAVGVDYELGSGGGQLEGYGPTDSRR